MRVYWDRCAGGRNFGDVLTLALLQNAGVDVEWAPPEEADVFGCGSIAEAIPEGFAGVVIGTGLMWRRRKTDLSTAKVLAVRGRLTALRAKVTDAPLADLGLLAIDLLTARPPVVNQYGTMRHFVDSRPPVGAAIDPLDRPFNVVKAAAGCARIVSSSLHGIVLADALGIENMWDPHPSVLGNGFKFADYGSAYGERIEPYTWRLADQAMVAEKQTALRAALATVVQ